MPTVLPEKAHLNLGMFTQEMLQVMERSVLCWLATADAGGNPNVSPKEIFSAVGSSSIVIAHIASPGSVKNLRVNPQACVSLVDVFAQRGFKFRGTAEIVTNKDARYEELERPLWAMTQGAFPIHCIMEIQVKAVEPILAPSYHLVPGTTEQSQIKAAMQIYGVQPLGSTTS